MNFEWTCFEMRKKKEKRKKKEVLFSNRQLNHKFTRSWY